MPSYLVTGGTGFLGRFLVQRLLDRGGDVHLLVREGSQGKLARHADRWGAPDRVHPLVGDLTTERLGLSDDDVERLRGVDHVVHAAAVYDLTADEQETRRANVDGTRAVVDLANELGAGRLHLISSVAVAGEYDGFFREDMFDEGQELPTPYHRTKFESEQVVRAEATVPWRVYRPSVIVGDSRHRRDGQDRRAVLLLPADRPPARPAAGVGAARRAGARPDQPRPRRLGGRRRRPPSPTPTGSTGRPSTWPTPGASAAARSSTRS